jgi:hypothetical protein
MVTMQSNLLCISPCGSKVARAKAEEMHKKSRLAMMEHHPLWRQQADNNENSTITRENVGGLSQQPPRAPQSRALFLNGCSSYLLYFWEDANAHQILHSSLQRLNNKAGAVDALVADGLFNANSSKNLIQAPHWFLWWNPLKRLLSVSGRWFLIGLKTEITNNN